MLIEEIWDYNQKFVEEKSYEKYVTSKYPEKKMAILSCMDTRLTELLPAALGLRNGDVKIIKNAGGSVQSPFDSVMRSLLVAIYDLGVNEIMVIGHTDCGVQHMDSGQMIEKMKGRGISEEHIEMMKYCGVNFDSWLSGFDDIEESVRETSDLIAHHPLVPKDIVVRGFIMDSITGKLSVVVPERKK